MTREMRVCQSEVLVERVTVMRSGIFGTAEQAAEKSGSFEKQPPGLKP